MLICCLISTIGLAQNAVDNTQSDDLINFLGTENSVRYKLINPNQISTPIVNNGSIFIEQIGANNHTNSNTRTISSAINLVQHGNLNSIRVDINAMSVIQNVYQHGDGHRLAEYSSTPSLNLKQTFDQNGYGQNLTIHGNNSLSEKMRLTMDGNARTIIIRNFN